MSLYWEILCSWVYGFKYFKVFHINIKKLHVFFLILIPQLQVFKCVQNNIKHQNYKWSSYLKLGLQIFSTFLYYVFFLLFWLMKVVYLQFFILNNNRIRWRDRSYMFFIWSIYILPLYILERNKSENTLFFAKKL